MYILQSSSQHTNTDVQYTQQATGQNTPSVCHRHLLTHLDVRTQHVQQAHSLWKHLQTEGGEKRGRNRIRQLLADSALQEQTLCACSRLLVSCRNT